MKLLTDQLGTAHFFKGTPSRIVSLVPSQTELLYDLGLEESIVGITKFCVHPAHFKATKKIVGGTKMVNFEKIRILNPDIIICNKEENTQEIVEELSSICPVWVTNIITIEDSFQMIADFGEIFNCVSESEIWNARLVGALNNFKSFIEGKPIKKAAYFIWKNPYMVAGSDNFINEMLKLNRFENIYQNVAGRYPEVEIENIMVDGNPDIIFLSSEPYPFKEEDALEISRYTSAKIVVVDGEMFSWYGSRLLLAFDYFRLLHQKL